ncbi:hypothetical protein QBC42DRAFT_167955 [Cladorrhinum samala]|uniref:DEAD/DEAH box helicase n=1 Tax=Cladorrhinum samala TaxID=585594 RepID=A0AAV9HYF2_9PEZI|nr:hypothetical protein QBC42DRAFT_167955 [Cladorrhinum samala]
MAEPANTIQETPVNGKIPLNPLRVDIVGDFAGKGLFAIHGEALLQHCLEQAKVDVNDGFQVLHAVYAVEDLLSKLATRGCNFHIVWFEYPMYPEEASSKFRAIRIILVEHFARLGNGLSYLFPSPASDAFQEYLRDNSIRFFWGSGTITRQMLSLGHCVAFIQDVEFKSSKVYTRMVTPLAARDVFEQEEEQPNSLPEASAGSRESLERLVKSSHNQSLTARELLSLHALSDILRSATSENSESISRQAAALLVHLVALRHSPLSQRSIDIDATASKPNPEVESFMSAFSDAVRDAAIGWSKSSHAELAWDAFDLIDGRLYSVILARVNAGIAKLGSELAAEAASLAELLTTVTGTDVSKYIPGPEPRSGEGEAKQHLSAPSLPTSVLPFSHPVLDPYLIKVQLESKDNDAPPPAPKIFAELTHWHNAKKPVDPKRIPPPLDFKARRRNQRFMADTMAYSASLTGASGKNIKPEIIVSSIEVPENKKAAAKLPQRPKPVQSAPKKKVVQKSGAQKAREEGERMKAEKTAVKSGEIVVAWKARCAEFEKEITPLRRYLKAEKYFLGLSPSHMEAISGEVILYIASVLVRMAVAKSQKAMDSTYFAINAMIWSRTIQASRLSLTKDIFNNLVILANSLRIPVQALGAPPAMARALAFKWPDIERSLLPKEVSATEFQLNFCGPYMDRSFDSAPDPRVTFPPDAWQRDVLDAIDARTSVLAIAPTSAGKTFISFYAMKKVLQANDDDVLVYIAPTKALVNQIAAEVQARFSKSYRQEGRSVWAIHTRDHRVNNPRGCQVLVTVPSMLQILLLAPSNAEGPKSFSNRLKWIIFDEVHSIGQSEEGVIWEQLLLMAPCPIIALSATVGNTLEFKDWLEGVQKAKGFDFRMVVHTSRYSDLRKFIHDPEPSTVVFKGLVKPERLPLPGLDSEADYAAPFYFVHPVASIVEKSRETLSDTSLEPRDCLSLWKSMASKQVDPYQVDNALDPELALPKLIQKSDVVGWESSLKNQLGEWIGNPLASPFEKVRQELLGPRYPQVIARHTGDMTAFTPEETETGAAVSSRSVFSLILDLRASGALPAIIFNYDRTMCEDLASEVLGVLIAAETKFRETDPTWIRKMDTFREWEKARDARLARTAKKAPTKRKGDDEDDGPLGKAESARDEASQDGSAWASFDPEAPLPQYSFADSTSMTASELEERLWPLQREAISPALINGLRRGIGVHHAGLNRKYRQAVEMLFRKGYLQVVMATGTLAMGINMPCKTVVFSGDSVYITALNYRQASGRAGRRGFDLLGNVVFHNINPHRSFEIMSAKLPDLRGQFPTSVTLILRLFTLLHGTNNAEFGKKMVAAVFSQSRLYLGGPEDQYSVAHHLRFSIDYLRRQNLLSEKGEPLNFAGLVGHLYYAENAVFAFHSLLREGYFHEICSQIDDETKQADILLEIMLVLCHLFCRFPCHQYKNETFIREVVYRSPSLIILPDLPVKASDALERHNKQTLDIFRGYVSSYIHQHLSTKPDNELPFSKIAVKPAKTEDLTDVVPIRPPTAIRSPFAALSGFTDDFETIKELCDTVRSDVFLEESAIPYIPIAPKETNGVPWNAYLYDFFKHGDVDAIVRDNGVRRGEVWYLLKDYSFILATITTSLANTLNPSAVEGDDIIGDTEVDEELGGDRGQDDDLEEAAAKPSAKVKETPVTVLKKKGKKKVADSWDDEESSEAENWDDEGAEEEKEDTPAQKIHQFDPANADQSLVKVYKAFSMLREQFDEKFYKMWA